jgi:hypothetical protein
LNKDFSIHGIIYFLLILYFIGISPSVVVHNHQESIIPYELASNCEKAVYYGETEKDLHHEEHVSATPETCLICDLHIVKSQLLLDFTFEFLNLPNDSRNPDYYFENLCSVIPHHFFNRGPPIA